MSSWDKSEEMRLLPKTAFNSNLNMSTNNDHDNEHA